jgi:hypothetical protein
MTITQTQPPRSPLFPLLPSVEHCSSLGLEDENDDEGDGRRRRMTITQTQPPRSPLFPLLPSVQILFATFC